MLSRSLVVPLFCLAALAGCHEAANPAAADFAMSHRDATIPSARDLTATDDAAGPVTCRGTVFPNAGLIDPDNPQFSDADHTAAEVTQMFATAKAQNTDAYRAYLDAHGLGDLLRCAFCTCGCNRSLGHVSAVDCFKSLHAFT